MTSYTLIRATDQDLTSVLHNLYNQAMADPDFESWRYPVEFHFNEQRSLLQLETNRFVKVNFIDLHNHPANLPIKQAVTHFLTQIYGPSVVLKDHFYDLFHDPDKLQARIEATMTGEIRPYPTVEQALSELEKKRMQDVLHYQQLQEVKPKVNLMSFMKHTLFSKKKHDTHKSDEPTHTITPGTK